MGDNKGRKKEKTFPQKIEISSLRINEDDSSCIEEVFKQAYIYVILYKIP